MKKKEELELTEGGFYYCETDFGYKWIFQKSNGSYKTSCTFCISDEYFGGGEEITDDDNIKNLRVATNEEQQLLLTQIKNHGK